MFIECRLEQETELAIAAQNRQHRLGDGRQSAEQGNAVEAASRDGDDVAQRSREIALAKSIIAPGRNGAVPLERQAVPCARGNSNNISQPRRYRSWPARVVTPADHGSISQSARRRTRRPRSP